MSDTESEYAGLQPPAAISEILLPLRLVMTRFCCHWCESEVGIREVDVNYNEGWLFCEDCEPKMRKSVTSWMQNKPPTIVKAKGASFLRKRTGEVTPIIDIHPTARIIDGVLYVNVTFPVCGNPATKLVRVSNILQNSPKDCMEKILLPLDDFKRLTTEPYNVYLDDDTYERTKTAYTEAYLESTFGDILED